MSATGARAVAVVFDTLLDPLRTELWVALGVGVAVTAGAIVAGLLHGGPPVAAITDGVAATGAGSSPGPVAVPGSEPTTTTPEPVPAPSRNTGAPGAPVREPSGNPRPSR